LRTRVVAFHTLSEASLVEARLRIWRLVVRDPRMIEICEDSGFWYDPQSEIIYVYQQFLQRDGWATQLRDLLRGVFHFPDLSETRWVGVRDSTSS
jgi:hypothetical protein